MSRRREGTSHRCGVRNQSMTNGLTAVRSTIAFTFVFRIKCIVIDCELVGIAWRAPCSVATHAGIIATHTGVITTHAGIIATHAGIIAAMRVAVTVMITVITAAE